ncbi:hypothetical protein [Aeromonas dhakensis]|uniref:hypothetical protein n=1 Tax=Aeromonas dhakensis TaxID=196024 RepID=UPI001C5B74A8|nr:hypothetical protein [Aeromonas dhakensis]MBW3693222.1 glycosyltransferase family 4 protein [Aeromonas dhakensis]
MNIVLFDLSRNLGGAETFNCRFVEYLVSNGDRVAIVSYEDSLILEVLSQKEIKVKKYIMPTNDDFFTSLRDQEDLLYLGRCILDGFEGEEVYILSSYFNVLHKAMYVFNGDKRAHILTGILHPEAWSIWEPDVGFNSLRAFKPKVINRLWHFQRNLLLKLDHANALWYINDTHRKYNEDYFDISLKNYGCITIPVEPYPCVVGGLNYVSESEIRVIWLGRFDFFKNPCIFKFMDELETLLVLKPDLNISFDLIGYGDGHYEHEVRSYASTKNSRLNIRFLGRKKIDDIYKIVTCGGYHSGLAMGTSAYHLAMMGLPVMVIEACIHGYHNFMRAMWLDDGSEEYDDGSGLYRALAGEDVEQRRPVIDVLSDIFVDGFLEKKSKSCRDYVEKHHGIDILMPKIRGLLLNSTYHEKYTYTFERNMPDEFYYRFGENKKLSVAIFGVGSGAVKFKGKLDSEIYYTGREIEVKFFLDNNLDKLGGHLHRIPIIQPSKEIIASIDVVIVATEYWPEIYSQLIEMGVERKKILRVY